MKKQIVAYSASALVAAALAGCSTPLTTREKGAGIGTLGGAAAGGIIGSTVGHAGAGAAIGGLLGLGAGALIATSFKAVRQKKTNSNTESTSSSKRSIDSRGKSIDSRQASINESG